MAAIETADASRNDAPSTSNTPLDLDTAVSDIKHLLDSSQLNDLHTLINSSLQDIHTHKSLQRSLFLTHSPTFLSLHDSLEHSISSLDSLSSFLSTFSNDLGSISHQISSLKDKSASIDQQLAAKRQLEEPLDRLLNGGGDQDQGMGIVIDPNVVARIFDTDVDSSTQWKEAITHLEQRIQATRRPLDELAAHSRSRNNRPSSSRRSSQVAQPSQSEDESNSYAALVEARQVAESCKIMAATKIRPYLLAPFGLLRKSVTTNLQINQTSILLPHHAPMYGFLARQMPRVAIDIQRGYVSAARLYFETGFRRYARSLNTIAKRGYSENGSSVAITDTRPTSWNIASDRLQHARVDGPSIVLGYQSDDSKFRAPPEALFRSLALVFFDNASSEYTFLVRYFESGLVASQSQPSSSRRDALAGDESSPSIPATPISERSETEASGTGGREDSVSMSTVGDDGDLVQLSISEKRLLKGRGGSSELFKKIFEPVINTWLQYSRSLISNDASGSSNLPLISLLSMIILTDELLLQSTQRGIESILMGPLLQFKMESLPLFQKRFQDEIILPISKLHSDSGSSSGWMKSASSVFSTGSKPALKQETIMMISERYSTMFVQVVQLTISGQEENSNALMLFSSLARCRNEIEKCLATREGKMDVARRIVRNLDAQEIPDCQQVKLERSHWQQMLS
ncbi:unnamed protein product [Sympodiomycopsis kandeliae]